jgi:hypothetical protein
MDILTVIIVAAFLIIFYFAPSLIASGTGHKNTTAIFLLNLFLGWSFIVWVICLVWAVINE